ncbi:LysM repeat protein [Sphingomonas sp. SORGH_AS438]|nr:LysM repeat protein [Sphingomonas sp. SORGH_AS_0438]
MAMRRAVVAATALMLGGCIPRMEPPNDYGRPAPPPPVDRTPPTTDFTPHDEAVAAQGRSPTRPVTRVAVPGAAVRPLWEARPVEADARIVEASTYVVRPGDTLRGIAERTGAGVDAIARANGIAAPAYVVRVGQRLTIPAGRYHLVRTGQTGIAIARAYGVEWSRIVAAKRAGGTLCAARGPAHPDPGGRRRAGQPRRRARRRLPARCRRHPDRR